MKNVRHQNVNYAYGVPSLIFELITFVRKYMTSGTKEDTAFVYHGKQCFRPTANSTTVEIRIISELNWTIFERLRHALCTGTLI